jgi:DNA relaxase NicK
MRLLSPKPSNFAARIDYLSISILPNYLGLIGEFSIQQYFNHLIKLLIKNSGEKALNGLQTEQRPLGMFNYKSSFNLMRPDASGISDNFTNIGVIACTLVEDEGKKYNAGIFLSITGIGCEDVNFPKFINQLIKDKIDFRITRLDIAVDYYFGEISIEQIKRYYNQGLFKSKGRPPRCWEIAPKIFNGEQHFKAGGYTFYVGSLSGSKSFRAYEKGQKHYEKDYDFRSPLARWIRLEVQFRNKQCEIPVEMVFDLDAALKGAYPVFEEIRYPKTAHFFEQENKVLKLKYKKRMGWLGLDHAVHWAGHSYKNLILYMFSMGYNFEQICFAIVLQKSPDTINYLELNAKQLFESEQSSFQIPKQLRA